MLDDLIRPGRADIWTPDREHAIRRVTEERRSGFTGRGSSATSVSSRDDVLLAAQGIIAQTCDLAYCTVVQALASGSVCLGAVGLRKGDVVANISISVGIAAAGTDPTLFKLGIYKSDGTVLGATADVKSDAKLKAGNSIATFALALAYTVPSDGLYYLAALKVGAYGTTQPTFSRAISGSTTAGAQLPALNSRRECEVSGQTDLVTVALASSGNAPYWLAAS